MDGQLSRREFLTRIGASALAIGGMAALAACGKSEGGAAECKDPSGATNAQRTQNQYVDKSAKADANCSNCQLYEAGEGGCGKCTLFGGSPVSPGGWCTAWAKKG